MPAKFEQETHGRPTPGKPGPGHRAAALLAFLAVSHAVSFLGSLAITNHASGWYAAANKAPWTPPDWVFGTVWTVLYTAMAVAAWLVWRQRSGAGRGPMAAYGVQLLLNLACAPTFFGMYPMLGTAAPWLAFLVIAARAVAVTVTVLRFGPISRTAGLLLPYISWIVFSSSLNFFAAANQLIRGCDAGDRKRYAPCVQGQLMLRSRRCRFPPRIDPWLLSRVLDTHG